MVREPTRYENTLDLFLTNTPNQVKSKVLPGLSDLDIILSEVHIKPKVRKQTPRVIQFYNRADWNTFSDHMTENRIHGN